MTTPLIVASQRTAATPTRCGTVSPERNRSMCFGTACWSAAPFDFAQGSAEQRRGADVRYAGQAGFA
jgi:hypothetical protein